MYEYNIDGYNPRKKKKRNVERDRTAKLRRILRNEHDQVCDRYPDDSNIHFDIDFWILGDDAIYCPIEWKAQQGGLKYDIRGWMRDQPHQYQYLLKCHHRGCRAFLGVFWKPIHKREYQIRILRVQDIPRDGDMPLARWAMVSVPELIQFVNIKGIQEPLLYNWRDMI